MTAPITMAKRAAAGTLALAVCLTGGVIGASAANAAPNFKFDQRISGADRYDTAVAASKFAFNTGAETVIITNGDAIVDGLTAAYAAGVAKAPILYVNRQGVPDQTAAEITRLGAKKIIIVGGTAVVPDAVKTQFESKGLTVTRESGADRYATAQAVATSASKTPDKILIASGEVPADALAAGPLAYAKNYPILLTRPDNVPSPTSDGLGQLGQGERIVIGGTARISDSTYTALGAKRRLSGPSRQETAIAVANVARDELGFDKDRFALVSDQDRNAVDALTAAPVAGKNLAPILFTNGDSIGDKTSTYLQSKAADLTGPGYIFGGTAAVPQAVADQGTAAAGGTKTPAPAPGVTITSNVAANNQVTYADPTSKKPVAVTYSSADKFTVDGADASIGAFTTAITAGDQLVITKLSNTTSKYDLTNVTVKSGLIDGVNQTNNTLNIVNPVTGAVVVTAVPFATANQFITYTIGGNNVSLAQFKANLNAGDSLLITGGDGTTSEKTQTFNLTDNTVSGSIKALPTPNDGTAVKITTPAGAPFTYNITGTGTGNPPTSYTIDGKAATLAQVNTAISIGDAATYSLVNGAATFTLTNAAPQATTATVSAPGLTGNNITYFTGVDGSTDTVAVPTTTTDVTFKVDGVVVTRQELVDAITPGDQITFQTADDTTQTKASFLLTNKDVSGIVEPGVTTDTLVKVFYGDSNTVDLATLDFGNNATTYYTGNTTKTYFVNGGTVNLADFTTELNKVETQAKTGVLTAVDNGSTTEFRLVSAVAAAKPISVTATVGAAQTNVTVGFNNPVYLASGAAAGDFVITKKTGTTVTAITYQGATPATVGTASNTVVLSIPSTTFATGDVVTVQLTEQGAAKFLDAQGKAATMATVTATL